MYTANWYTVESTGGVLAAGDSIQVSVCPNDTADNMSTGTYSDTLVFSNITLGTTQPREVVINILPEIAAMPFSDGFEGGTLADYWVISGTEDYRTQIQSSPDAHGGTTRSQFFSG